MRNYLTTTLFENFHASFAISAVAGFIPTLIMPNFYMWINANIDYVNIALGAIVIDHILGSWVHYFKKKDFSWKLNISGLFVKITMVIAFAFMMEGLAHITIEDDFIYKYIKMSGRILVVIYPIRSAMRNMHIMTNGRFPSKGFVGKIDHFEENMDLNVFRDNNNNNNSNYGPEENR